MMTSVSPSTPNSATPHSDPQNNTSANDAQPQSAQPNPVQPSEEITAEVVVIGGGVAGLAASVALARSLRDVVVIDAGAPRNRFSAHAHNVLGQEGISPFELVAKGRAEAQAYGVRIIEAEATNAQVNDTPSIHDHAQTPGAPGGETPTVNTQTNPAHSDSSNPASGFSVDTSIGIRVYAKRIIIATGLTDVLPEIPGLAEGWGETVLHCPYCHGYEVRGQSIAIIGTTPMAQHQALMFSQLSDRVTLIRHEAPAPTVEERATLNAHGVTYVDAQVGEVEKTEHGTVVGLLSRNDEDESTSTQPRTETFDALTIGPFFRANGEIFTRLGGHIADHESGLGTYIPTAPNGQTDIPGVWAVGNSADMMAMVVASAADGVKVGAQVNADLIFAS